MEVNVSLIGIYDRIFRVHWRPNDLYLKPIAEAGIFEEGLLYGLLYCIDEDYVCLDIGASYGLTTLVMSQLCRKGHCYAFEPNSVVYPYLQETITSNAIENVTLIPLALSDTRGKQKFIVDGQFLAGGALLPERIELPEEIKFEENRQFGYPIEVDSETLDNWVETQKISRIDFIKIDVEGAEGKVLEGAYNTIRKFRPTVAIEFNSYTLVKFQEENPRRILLGILEIFDSVFCCSELGALERIQSAEEIESFLDKNFRQLLASDLICTFEGNDFLPLQEQRFRKLFWEKEKTRQRKEAVSAERDQAIAERDQAVAERYAVFRSASWKITGPIRALVRLFSRSR